MQSLGSPDEDREGLGGSGVLVQELIADDLVDRYQLFLLSYEV